MQRERVRWSVEEEGAFCGGFGVLVSLGASRAGLAVEVLVQGKECQVYAKSMLSACQVLAKCLPSACQVQDSICQV